jgi:hypothetical protein
VFINSNAQKCLNNKKSLKNELYFKREVRQERLRLFRQLLEDDGGDGAANFATELVSWLFNLFA